jgi:hypothetical protein
MIFPTINLNGTSADELIAQQQAIWEAADRLLTAMRAATPHGRDYPNPVDWSAAGAAHMERVQAVAAIMNLAKTTAQHIMGIN